jgi:hypothetical protein
VILVEVRCKVRGCRALLDEVVSAPPAGGAEWEHYVRVSLCQKHGEGAGHGNIMPGADRSSSAAC